MFDFDNFREIWSTIRKNKLRTFLTGFSVAWGIFMLITLLGAGNGLRNGVMLNFRNMSMNKVEVWTRYTTLPWKGMPTNRSLKFQEKDFAAIKLLHPEIDQISATVSHSDTLYFEQEYITGEMSGVYPDHADINYVNVDAKNGRFINDLDMHSERKVIVLSPRMAEVLFRQTDPIGQYVKAGNTMYQVVGVYNDDEKSNNAPAYIPFTTARTLYNKGYGFNSVSFTLKGVVTEKENEAFEQRFRHNLAYLMNFNPDDTNAIGLWNTARDFRMTNNILTGILAFIWIVGISTLMAGIVGVSNIMLITVRERTREFGIRKAIGAKPASILRLVISESVLVTAVFGYMGMVLGIELTELINYGMMMAGVGQSSGGNPGENMTIFYNPTVNLNVALAATCLIVIAGVLAGYFPARKATKISAIEAMRSE